MQTVTGHPETTEALSQAEVARIKADFEILEHQVNGTELIYLDSGATSQKPRCVYEAEQHYYENANSAVHRGAHTLAVEATDIFEQARETVAKFIGARSNELVWTSNATEALNLISYSLSNASLGRGGESSARFRIGAGDEILVTEIEHHANLIPWQELAFRTGATLRYVPVDEHGALRYELLDELINEKTKLVAFTHVSNVLGTITDVARFVTAARKVGALTVLDGCQSVPHMPVDVKALDVDFMAFSGHKMLGPTGIGGLYGRAELLDAMPPFLTGGSMITVVDMEHAEFLPSPQRFEAGTQRIAQVHGLATAASYLDEIGMDRIAAWEEHLGAMLFEGLSKLEGVRVFGPSGIKRIGTVPFEVIGVHPHDVGQFLDSRGIAVRVGHHCAQPLHRALGVSATTRASTYLYNTEQDVTALIEAVASVREYFGV
ncbi:cysteine desulfurase [Arthrobacter sp. MYb224]|uniref:SufS family cysteine desulfurase n=1 Tax=Micrococcaceae TaxID=1268 RepID=UPI000CFD201D|nr:MULTISPECIES: SufS family cysteine desulfurase [unclassified Arthrobacter]PQZ98255.1 cysteine desulfurase [Arthrobacter sp. MYb224]PRA02336.1 cysteine desulfurase [Arthrobacter sp. MYb229]PRB50721.1 cysteine desulfurase [Arthrobacter sp. MYb216]